MAYLAGMIWSVSTLAPNFQARPRTVLGSVTVARPRRPASPGDRTGPKQSMTEQLRGGVSVGGACPPCAIWPRTSKRVPEPLSGESSDLGGHLRKHLGRVSDHARDRTRRRHGRVRQIDLRLRVAHPAGEVAVGRAEAHLTFAEHAHVPPEAGAAGRGSPCRAGGQERADEAFLLGLDSDQV